MLIRLISQAIHGFGYNLMTNCPIKKKKVSNHMLSGLSKPTMLILVRKYYCIMGNMQLIYLICNFKSFFP